MSQKKGAEGKLSPNREFLVAFAHYFTECSRIRFSYCVKKLEVEDYYFRIYGPKGSDFVILRNKFLGSTFLICFEGLLTYQFLHSKMMWRFYQILGAVIFENTEYLVFFSKKRVFSKLMIEIIHF